MTQKWAIFFCLLQIISVGAMWESNGKTVAGGNGGGDALNQLNSSYGVFVDSDDAVFVADYSNHRVVKWSKGASNGTLLAGGECGDISRGQLCHPSAITLDKEGTMFIAVEDNRFGDGNGSIIRWEKGAASGETIIFTNTSFYGITLDAEEKYLYVGHHRQHRVLKYTKNGTLESVVAGGNGRGPALDQLDYPRGVAVDKSGSVYVADSNNQRVVKWTVNASEGIVVAGGNGNGSQTNQLNIPGGMIVDEKETIYVVDERNQRVVSISAGAQNGIVIAGGHGSGPAANQFDAPVTLAFNRQGDLYVSDQNNHRIQMFTMHKTPASGSTSNYICNSLNKSTLIYIFISLIISLII